MSFYHALCDGRGMPFIESLIHYYCQLRYGSKVTVGGVRLADDTLFDGETIDPFMRTYDFDKDKELICISRDAYAVTENVVTEEKTNYRYEARIPRSVHESV